MNLLDFKKHLSIYLNNEDIEKLINSFDLPANHSLLINKYKFDIEKLKKYYKSLNKHSFIDNVYYYDNKIDECGKSFLFDNGAYYIIDASSLLISYFLELKDNENILDLCSAPGGKSISLSLKNKNINIISNDLSFSRIKEMEKNIERLGLENIILTNNDFSDVYKNYSKTFDKIILDAPCSGSGMFRKNDLVKEDWSIEKVKHFSKIQNQLIEIAYSMLKEGGTLVYSTCSYSYEENEEVILSFLKNHDDIELIDLPHIKGEYRSNKLKKAIHLFPYLYKGEGFFLCFLKKKGLLIDNKIENKKEYFKNLYFKNKLVKNDKIYLYNNALNLKYLNVIKYGLEAFNQKKNILIPTFHLAHYLPSNNSISLTTNESKLYLHGDTFLKDTTKKGYQIVSYDSLNLGYTKIVNNIFKNFYPKGLRH